MTKTIAVLIGIMFVQIGPVTAADRVRIGVPQQVIHWMTFPLAYKRGFFKEDIDEAKKAAKVEREVALNEVADLSILKQTQRELGTKAK